MNKKRIILGTIIIFVLSAIFHSVYDKFPNLLTSLFFPVNESIWEHNKLIVLSFFIWTIIEKIFFDNKENTILKNLIATILCIVILNLTFTPFYLYILNTNDNFIITLSFYLVSIIISLILSDKTVLKYQKNKNYDYISLLGFAVISIILMILTYNPPMLAIFYDFNDNVYGIK